MVERTGVRWGRYRRATPACWRPTPVRGSTSSPMPISAARWPTPSPSAPGTAPAAAMAPRPPSASPYAALDQFTAISYSGSNGSASWAGAWQEIGESDGASAGQRPLESTGVVIAGPYLEIGLDTAGVGLSRAIDLSGATSVHAQLRPTSSRTSRPGARSCSRCRQRLDLEHGQDVQRRFRLLRRQFGRLPVVRHFRLRQREHGDSIPDDATRQRTTSSISTT